MLIGDLCIEEEKTRKLARITSIVVYLVKHGRSLSFCLWYIVMTNTSLEQLAVIVQVSFSL